MKDFDLSRTSSLSNLQVMTGERHVYGPLTTIFTPLEFVDLYVDPYGLSIVAGLPNNPNRNAPFDCPSGWTEALTFNEDGYFISSATIGGYTLDLTIPDCVGSMISSGTLTGYLCDRGIAKGATSTITVNPGKDLIMSAGTATLTFTHPATPQSTLGSGVWNAFGFDVPGRKIGTGASAGIAGILALALFLI
ncbi:MAG: hypothetical protein M1840_005849 [Geoglossum simile]|nr:MAG: hypothetical protein M1840_005849 [Geoglossum simile]